MGLYDDEYPEHEYKLADGAELRKCEECGRIRACEYGVNPFSAEIHQDYTQRWACGGCDYESAMDI